MYWQFGRDDELNAVEDPRVFRALIALAADQEMLRRSTPDRARFMLAAGAVLSCVVLMAVLLFACCREVLAWIRQLWAATAEGAPDLHLIRFGTSAIEGIRWPGPWPMAVAVLLAGLLLRVCHRSYLTQRAVFDQRLDALMRPPLREFINRHSNHANPPVFNVVRAPGLTHVNSADRLVDRPESKRILRLITDLGATSLAVSGRRGSGKSTVLRHIAGLIADERADTTWATVHVHAPVGYDSREFLVHLHIRLCEAVAQLLHDGAGTNDLSDSRLRRGLRFTMGSLAFLTISYGIQEADVHPVANPWDQPAGAILYQLHQYTQQQWLHLGPDLSQGIVLYAVLLLLLVLRVVVPRLGWRSLLPTTARNLARPANLKWLTRRTLDRLRFIQTTNSNLTGALKAGRVDLGWGRSRQLADIPLSLPELVGSYREYVEAVALWRAPGQRPMSIIVTIDEMDRITDAEQAERFLNDIKAIFNLPGCIYLVSVSDDALAGFESRIIHLRTAMDSSFDDVIRMPPFTLEQSIELIRRRVVGFPDVFTALCHCVSGGIPRDLVRAARSLIELRRLTEATSSSSLATSLINAEVSALRRGLSGRTQHDEAFTERHADLVQHFVEPNSESSSKDLFREAKRISRLTLKSPNPTADRLVAGLEYYATVLEVFEVAGDFVTEAVRSFDSPEHELLAALAQTRSTLQVSATAAAAEVQLVRRSIRARQRGSATTSTASQS
ncbi:hypothetical protein [Kribbella yunnanensis]|uniref:hypothetical protein n=1 Tax=Kribbella yunnanensis TaxID=190194 RepID=UPI0031E3BD5C